MPACLECGKETNLRCSACKQAYFCSAACTRSAWKEHKKVCKKIETKQSSSLSTPNDANDSKSKTIRSPESSLEGLRSFMRSIKDSDIQTSKLLQGLFREIGGSVEAFCRHSFPGISASQVPKGLPHSMRELLTNNEHDSLAKEIAVAAFEKSISILKAVNMKAVAQGQSPMDAATETSMWPSIFAESFAREILPRFSKFAADSNSRKTVTEAQLASPYHALARTEQIGKNALSRLISAPSSSTPRQYRPFGGPGCGWAFQRGPFHADVEDWYTLVLEDMGRLAGVISDEGEPIPLPTQVLSTSSPSSSSKLDSFVPPGKLKFSPLYWSTLTSNLGDDTSAFSVNNALGGDSLFDVAVGSRWAWLDGQIDADQKAILDPEGEFPAISELVARLHTIPYEMNRKAPNLRLLEPLAGMTLLRHYRVCVFRKRGAGGHGDKARSQETSKQFVMYRTVLPEPPLWTLDGREHVDLQSFASSISKGADVGYKITVTYVGGATSDLGVYAASMREKTGDNEDGVSGTYGDGFTVTNSRQSSGSPTFPSSKISHCAKFHLKNLKDPIEPPSSSSSTSTGSTAFGIEPAIGQGDIAFAVEPGAQPSMPNTDTVPTDKGGNRLIFHRSRQVGVRTEFSVTLQCPHEDETENSMYLRNNDASDPNALVLVSCADYYFLQLFLHSVDDNFGV